MRNAAKFSLLYLGWTLLTIISFVTLLKSNIIFIIVSFVTSLTFLLLTLEVFGLGTGQIGGYLGIITALFACYTAPAFLLDEMRGPFSLPVGPRR